MSILSSQPALRPRASTNAPGCPLLGNNSTSLPCQGALICPTVVPQKNSTLRGGKIKAVKRKETLIQTTS